MHFTVAAFTAALVVALSGCASGPVYTPTELALRKGEVDQFRAVASSATFAAVDPMVFDGVMRSYALAPSAKGKAVAIVNTLVEKGVDLNRPFNRSPHSLLWFLCGQPEAMALAIARGADLRQRLPAPTLTNVDEATPLGGCALQAGDFNRQANVTLQAGNALVASYHRIWSDEAVRSATVLLQAGADPDETAMAMTGGGKRRMPVALTAFGNGVPKLGILLLSYGANPFASNDAGSTFLHATVGLGDYPTTKVLIDKARVVAIKQAGNEASGRALFKRWLDQKTSEGSTSLHFASAQYNLPMIELLIRSGADHTLRNADGLDAQQIADARRERNEAERQARVERQRQQAEAAERNAREAEATKQGVLALVGAAAIGKATAGKNYTYEQRSSLVDGWTQDRMNAANGVTSDKFGQAASRTHTELNMARLAQETRTSEARTTTAAPREEPPKNQKGAADPAGNGSRVATSTTSSAQSTPPKQSGYPKIVDSVWQDAQLNRNTVKGWCETKKAELKASYEAAGDEVLKFGPCTCTDVSMTKALQAEFACKFAYTYKQNGWRGEK